MNHSQAVRAAVPLTAILLAAGGGAWALQPRSLPGGPGAGDRMVPAAYHTFPDCPSLLAHLRSQARPLVGPYGLPGVPGVDGPVVASARTGSDLRTAAGEAVPAARAPGLSSASVAQAAPSAPDTGTNVQVAGVDEADVSKRVGDRVFTVSGRAQGLTVLRTSGRAAAVAGRLDLGWRPAELLVAADTVLLLGPTPLPPPVASTPRGAPDDVWPGAAIRPQATRTRIAEVDVADPAHLRLVRTLDLDGSSVGARLAGGVLRLALSAGPSGLPFVGPHVSGTGDPGSVDPAAVAKAEAAALARNRAVITESTVDQWLPHYTLTPAGGGATSGLLLGCDSVGVPDRFSGLGTLALLTFDLHTQGVAHWNGAGVVAGGTTLYSTADHSYVATTAWQPPVPLASAQASGGGTTTSGTAGHSTTSIVPTPTTTQIHAFSTTAGGVRYLGSGRVEGRLLDQYALDEYEGRLRVATTSGPAWPGVARPLAEPAEPLPPGVAGGTAGIASSGSAASASSSDPVPRPAPATTTSQVTVLQLRGGRLVQVGQVGGLGVGETIHGVRFAGPVGYVVTFRRTDPLYTLDLSDPTHPTVAGRLMLLGYSAYLHPLGDGLLFGVGQDASADGVRRGVLLSLFDVADPARPRLVDRVTVPGSWAGTEIDAHAFTYAGGLATVPLGSGVLAVRVEQDRLGTPSVLQLDRSGDAGLDAASARTFVDGDTLWTVAPAPDGALLAAHDAASLTWLSAVSF